MAYKLDYSIERDSERLTALNKILNEINTAELRKKDLETMANYLLYGKDENGKNSMQRKEVLDNNKKHSTYRTKNQREESLDAIIEAGLEETKNFRQVGEKSIYKAPKQCIEPRDRDLPCMAALQDAIARIDHSLKAYKGKETLNDEDTVINSDYQAYLLNHALVDMRKQQYYIKDAYRPTIHFLTITNPGVQHINWDGLVHVAGHDSSIGFDWENYKHVAALIRFYGDIAMEGWEDPLGWEKIFIYDFDRYVDMAHLTPEKEFILTLKIDKLTYNEIQHEVEQKFGRKYTINYISLLTSEKIPLEISAAAKRHRLILDKDYPRKECDCCGTLLPDNAVFFKEPFCVCKKCYRGRKQWQKKEHV